MDRTVCQRQLWQWAQAIQTWEGEGGRAPDQLTRNQSIALRDDAQADRVRVVLG
jgi:hypothetical protein